MKGRFLTMTTAIGVCLGSVMVTTARAAADPLCNPEQFEERVGVDKRGPALQAVRNCLERDRDNPRLLVALGHLLLAGDDVRGAQDAYNKALQLDPMLSSAITGMATVLVRQGKLNEAEKLLTQLLLTSPRASRIYLELGQLYEQQGEHARALKTFKEGVRVYEQGRR